MKLFAVLGLGQFGFHVASELSRSGVDVIVVDRNAKRVESLKDVVSQAVCMDSTDMAALRAVGVDKAQTAVVALGESDLEASILSCAALHDLGVGQIVVRSANPVHGKILERVGATKLIYPEKEMGEYLAKSILLRGVIDQVSLSTGQAVAQILPRADLIGKRLKDAKLRELYRINVIGILKPKEIINDEGIVLEERELISVPEPDDIIGENDILMVCGFPSQIEHVARKD